MLNVFFKFAINRLNAENCILYRKFYTKVWFDVKNAVTRGVTMIRICYCLLFIFSAYLHAGDPVSTVKYVDLEKYSGLWYEIATIPQYFQRKCISETTANYEILPKGSVKVTNSCRTKKGELLSVEGRAKVVDKKTNAKLKVTFVKFINWIYAFGGNYWVIGLDSDYSYAVVGDPTRKYAWILSRTPVMDPEDLKDATRKLKDNGYDTCALLTSIQVGASERLPLCEVVAE
jgi:apolipoprotein D and lipocalin family protein